MTDGQEIYIKGEKYYLRKVKWPLCTGCYFIGRECPIVGKFNCFDYGNHHHEYILTKTRNEKIIYRFISSLLTFGV
jgi:hypothetical protein